MWDRRMIGVPNGPGKRTIEINLPEGWTAASVAPRRQADVGYPALIYVAGKSAIRWTITGTHTGSTEELPATGEAMSLSGSSVAHYAEGKLTEEWAYADNHYFIQQLGFTLAPAAAEEESAEDE